MRLNNIVECLSLRSNESQIALVCGNKEISYKKLYDYAMNYSIHFKENELVGIICTNSIEFVVAYFAVIIAKGIVLLLNKELTSIEVMKICRQCGSKRVLFSGEINTVDGLKFEKIDEKLFTLQKNAVILKYYHTDDIVTLMPTSGTTDQAKIVSLTHRSFVNGVYNTIDISGREKKDVEIVLLSFATRTALEGQLLTGLAVGMKIVLYNGILFPRKVFELIDSAKINCCSITPSVFRLLFDSCDTKNTLDSLKTVVVVGEKIPNSILEDFFVRFKKIKVLYGYGMTETGPIAFKKENDYRNKVDSVGKVVVNNELFLDKCTSDGDEKQIGEIVVKSPSMMKGYFQSNFELFDGEKIRTGDVGYLDSDGYLYIVGRIKNIINNNGYKIFPEEIESVLLGCKEVKDVLVRGEKNGNGGESVVADVVTYGSDVRFEEIVRYCSNYLANYKIPKKFYFCEEIPKVGASQKKRRQKRGE